MACPDENPLALTFSPEFGSLPLRIIDAVLHDSPDMTFVFNRAGQSLYAGAVAAQGVGRPPEAMLGKTLADLGVAPNWDTQMADLCEQVMATEQSVSGEVTLVTISGLRPFEFTLSPVRDLDGQPQAVLCIARDVADRKREEAALRDSEERFRASFEQAAVGIAHVGIAGNWLRINQKLCDILGYACDELLALTYHHIRHPDDIEDGRTKIRSLLVGDLSTYTVERRYLRQDRSIIWANLTISLVRDASNTPAYFVCVIEDITTRKRAEAQLQRQAELLDLAHDAIFVHNLHGGILFWNRSCEQQYGWSREEALGRMATELLPTQFPVSEEVIWQALTSSGQWEGELTHTRRDGSTVLVSSRWALQRDENGEPVAILEINRNLTAQKQQEAQIAALNRDLRRRLQEAEVILQTVPAAVNISEDPACLKIYGNAATYRMLRLPDGTNISKAASSDKIPSFRVFQGGQEIPDVDLPLQVAARTGQEIRDAEFDIVFADGVTTRWYGGASPLFDEQGTTRGSVGAFVDITPLKAAHAENAQLNERLHRAVYESSHRIKNQLQMLTATADLVLMDGVEMISVDEVRRLRAQIAAIAVTHELLTKETRADGAAAHISLQGVLERTLAALQHTSDRHHLTYVIDTVQVPVKAATSMALIVNETVSNAIKHGGRKVEVTLIKSDGQGRLEVCDDGPGFPDGFDARRAANTGLDLLMTLTQIDLGGIVEFANRREGGARVVVTFPLPVAP